MKKGTFRECYLLSFSQEYMVLMLLLFLSILSIIYWYLTGAEGVALFPLPTPSHIHLFPIPYPSKILSTILVRSLFSVHIKVTCKYRWKNYDFYVFTTNVYIFPGVNNCLIFLILIFNIFIIDSNSNLELCANYLNLHIRGFFPSSTYQFFVFLLHSQRDFLNGIFHQLLFKSNFMF